jgi:glutaryl-CoA dehydrogenase
VEDFLNLEEKLTDEESMMKDTVRDFVQNEVKPDLGDHFEAGTFPEELIETYGDMGFYAPNLDGYGFANVSETAYGLMMKELEAGDSGLRSLASVQGSLVIYPIYTYGSDDQKEKYLPGLRNGEIVGCFGLTEPEHGSEPSAMETVAEKDGSDYVLNGSKTWITNATIADLGVIWAKDRSDDDAVRGFLVPMDRKGVETYALDDKLSMRVSKTGSIELDDVRIPSGNRLPEPRGMKGPLSCLTQGRYGIVWGVLGAARDAYLEALEYTRNREQWGRPVAGFQLQQEKFAEMLTQISLGELLAYRLARLKENGDLTPQQVSMGKRNNVNMAREQVRVAREMMGGNGITTDYSPMRHLANMETVYTYEGTHDIHSLILGAEITGLEAFEG